MAHNGSAEKKIRYIYSLPYIERTELCRILDQNNKWKKLAVAHMGYDSSTIEQCRTGRSPTDELLTLWSQHNHTILELFILLSKMQHYQAMVPLKRFVDSKYHVLIDNGEGNLRRLFRDLDQENTNANDMKIGAQNFNRVQYDRGNFDKFFLNGIENGSGVGKILNRSPRPSVEQQNSDSDNVMATSQNILPTLRPVAGNSKINNKSKSSFEDTALPEIPYQELTRATNGWSTHTILGKGGFGTVFRGTWKNTQVAIKRIEKRGLDSTESYLIQLQQSLRELKILNACRHDNILSLYAYSIVGEAPCLVYQYLANGSLEDRLLLKKRTEPLTWLQRHEIAKGTARGLQFLHTIGNKPLIHGDIKSANILLDRNFEPKIGDFGLAREGPKKDSMKVSKIHGTRPYLPDEFLHEKNLSTKIDTYSFGIVLFELATGLTAYDHARPTDKYLKDFIENCAERNLIFLKDRKAGTENEQVFDNFIVLGKWCSNRLSVNRPEMVIVFEKINQL